MTANGGIFYPQVTHRISGNTAGGTALVSSGTYVLAGGANITLSQDANSVTIVGGAGGGGDAIRGIAAGGSTATTNTVLFSDANGVSFGFGAAGNSTVLTASVVTSYAPSNHSHGNPTLALTNLTGTTASASNGFTLSLSGNAAAPAQTNQTIGLYASSNTTLTSSGTADARSLSFRGIGGVSVGVSNNEVLLSAVTTNGLLASQSTQFLAITLGGNTAGTTTFHATNNASIFLHGGNNITLSGNGSSITISGAAGGGGAVVSNAIQQVSSATGSGTNTSRFAADDHVHAGVYGVGVSNDAGNTAGNTRVSFGQHVFRGGANITLSQITAANELNTIVISAAAGGAGGGATVSALPPLYPVKQTVLTATVNSGASGGTGGSTQWTYSGRLWPVDVQAEVHWSELYSNIGIAATSAGTGSATNQLLLGIYSLNANTVLSLLTSYAWSHAMSQNSVTARSHRWGWGTDSTSNSSSLGGNVSATFTGSRMVIAHSANQTLSTGRWYFGQVLLQRTTSVNVFQVVSLAEELGSASTSGYTIFGTNNLVSRPGHLGGVFSTTTNTPAITVTAMPASINTTAITQTNNASRWRPVYVQMLRSKT